MNTRIASMIVAALTLGLAALGCAGAPPPAPASETKPAPAAQPAAAQPAPPSKPAAEAKPAQPATPSKPAAEAKAAAPAQMVKVKLGYTPLVDFITFLAAHELGYFKQEGIDSELIQFKGGGEVTQAMLGRSIDIQATTADRALILAEKGQQTKNLVSVNNRPQQALIVRSDVDIAYGDIKALKGKKIGVTTAGGGADTSLRYYLKTVGLEPDKDVAIIAVGPPAAMIAALQAKQVDGINTFEPAIAQAVDVMKIAKPILDAAKDAPGLFKNNPYIALSATTAWLDANAETAKRLIRAQVRANNELRANPQRGLAIIPKFFDNLDPAVAEAILKKQAPYWVSAITEEEIAAASRYIRDIGLLTKDVKYDDVVAGKDFRDLWK